MREEEASEVVAAEVVGEGGGRQEEVVGAVFRDNLVVGLYWAGMFVGGVFLDGFFVAGIFLWECSGPLFFFFFLAENFEAKVLKRLTGFERFRGRAG